MLTFTMDESVVDNGFLVPRGQNRRRNRHILDGEPSSESGVVFSDLQGMSSGGDLLSNIHMSTYLLSVIEVLLALHRAHTGFRQDVDIGNPLGTPANHRSSSASSDPA